MSILIIEICSVVLLLQDIVSKIESELSIWRRL